MRKAWFDYVAKIRKTETRKKKTPCSHRQAMAVASQTWPKERLKLQRKIERGKRKAKTETQKVPEKKEPELQE